MATLAQRMRAACRVSPASAGSMAVCFGERRSVETLARQTPSPIIRPPHRPRRAAHAVPRCRRTCSKPADGTIVALLISRSISSSPSLASTFISDARWRGMPRSGRVTGWVYAVWAPSLRCWFTPSSRVATSPLAWAASSSRPILASARRESGPHVRVRVDLTPCRAADFAATSHCQDCGPQRPAKTDFLDAIHRRRTFVFGRSPLEQCAHSTAQA